MKAYDFEYDGIVLSDFGYIIADFNIGAGGLFKTISNGSKITWNAVPFKYGEYTKLTHHTYDSVLTTTIQICKDPCEPDYEIGNEDLRWMMRWLNRQEYLPFKILEPDFIHLNFNVGINVSKITLGDAVVGLSLDVTNDSPFAYGEPHVDILSSDHPFWRGSITNLSDKDGSFYPKVTIELLQGGDLIVANEMEESRTTVIKNCTPGEIITMEAPLIETSVKEHRIQDDFNWNFIRLASSLKDAKNPFFVSLPAKITFEYKPYIKLAF